MAIVGKNKMAHNGMREDRCRQIRVRIRVFPGEANHEWPAVDANAMRVLSSLIRVYDRVIRYNHCVYFIHYSRFSNAGRRTIFTSSLYTVCTCYLYYTQRVIFLNGGTMDLL